MLYALVQGTNVITYPFNPGDLRAMYPNASLPAVWTPEFMAQEGIVQVHEIAVPQYNVLTHRPVDSTPTYNASLSRWEQHWELVALSAQEQAAAAQALQADIVAQTQARLDVFAMTRNYDSILSACTYANSTVPKFQAEGQYCVDARDQTWAALYTLLAEVQAGSRPAPNSFADVEPHLPALAWPQ